MKNIKFEKQKINKTEIGDKEYLNLYFRNINSLILKKHKPSRKKFKWSDMKISLSGFQLLKKRNQKWRTHQSSHRRKHNPFFKPKALESEERTSGKMEIDLNNIFGTSVKSEDRSLSSDVASNVFGGPKD